MERIKDFLFDLSDVLISLVIIALIFGVVSWKLSETMPISFALFQEDVKEKDKVESPGDKSSIVTVVDGDAPSDTTPVNIVIGDNTSDPASSGTGDATGDVPDTTKADQAEDSTTTSGNSTVEAPTTAKTVTIEIPAGSSGDGIARILKSKGLITDIKTFNKTVETLGVGNKLRAGNFTLKTDMSVETIIKKITGQK